ncbi:MAG: glycosyltransferase family 2 protein [Planctomycetota bacterium]|nr:glycosyltransferase family 2 protein [Planctomycetota bacterium]
MTAETIDLSVIIVNWNTRELLLRCLETLYPSLTGIRHEVIVVDNDSQDGSVGAVREQFPEATILANSKNLGFARANNQAFRQARGRYYLLLNSDVEVKPEAIPGTIRFLDDRPRAGAAGIQLFFPDGRKQNSFDSFPTIATEILNKSLLRWLFPKALPSKNQEYTDPLPVDIVIGAFLMVRREAVEEVGPFDEKFFLFMEEADWCLRMRRSGWEIYHLPHLTAIHHHGASKRKLESASWIEYYRSTYIYFRKHRSLVAYVWLRVLRFFKMFVNLGLTTLGLIVTGFRRERHRKKFFIYLDVVLWHLALCPEQAGLRKWATRRP